MIPQKVKDHIEEYISQEVYVQIAIFKGQKKSDSMDELLIFIAPRIL